MDDCPFESTHDGTYGLQPMTTNPSSSTATTQSAKSTSGDSIFFVVISHLRTGRVPCAP